MLKERLGPEHARLPHADRQGLEYLERSNLGHRRLLLSLHRGGQVESADAWFAG